MRGQKRQGKARQENMDKKKRHAKTEKTLTLNLNLTLTLTLAQIEAKKGSCQVVKTGSHANTITIQKTKLEKDEIE
jgi:hypothetical protein